MNAVAEMAKPETKAEPKEELKRVKPSAFQISEYAFARYSVVLPVGWALDDVLDPEAWAQVAHKLDQNKITRDPARVGTIIEVRTEDHAFYAELYVRAVRKMALDVAVIQHKSLAPGDKNTGKFDVRWNVGKRGFDIIRLSDKTVVASGLPKKEDAHAWIEKTAG